MSDDGSEGSPAPARPQRRIKKVMVLSSASETDSDDSDGPLRTRKRRLRVASDSDGAGSSGSSVGARRRRALPQLRDSDADSDSASGACPSAPAQPRPSSGFASDSSEGNSDKCSICLLRFTDQEVGTPQSCEHIFCLDCITEWSKNVNTCPVDRISFDSIVVRACAGGRVLRADPVQVVERRPSVDMLVVEDPTACEICGSIENEDTMLLCDGCDLGFHMQCLSPPLLEIPVDEWHCPSCISGGMNDGPLEDVIYLSEMEDLFEDAGELAMPRGPRPTPLRAPRGVRRSARGPDQPSTSGARRAVAAPARAPRRRRRRTRKTVIIEYEIEENGKFPVTRRVKKTVRKRKIRKRRPRTAARRTLVRASVRAGLAALKGAAAAGAAGPVPSVTAGVAELHARRAAAGVPALSLFGSDRDLDYFEDDDDDAAGPTFAARPARPGRAVLSAYRQARRKMLVPTPPPASAAPDLLSDILESQSRLHARDAVVSVAVGGAVRVTLRHEERLDPARAAAAARAAPAHPGQRGGWGGGYAGNYHREQSANNFGRGYEGGAPGLRAPPPRAGPPTSAHHDEGPWSGPQRYFPGPAPPRRWPRARPPQRHSFGGFEDPLDMRVPPPRSAGPPAPRPMRPPPAPPVFRLEQDDDDDAGLVIDTDKYDPTEPTVDEDDAAPAPAPAPTVAPAPAPAPAPVVHAPLPPPPLPPPPSPPAPLAQGLLDTAVAAVLAEHRALLAPPAPHSDEDDDGDCPNFSIYSATSVHIASGGSLAPPAVRAPPPPDLRDLVQQDDGPAPAPAPASSPAPAPAPLPLPSTARDPIKIKLQTSSLLKRISFRDDSDEPAVPEPADKQFVPADKQPEPADKQPEPVDKQPEPAEQPEPADKQPEPVDKQPEPADKQPEPLDKQPEPADKQPEPVDKQPEPAEQSEPADKQPEPVDKQPEPPSDPVASERHKTPEIEEPGEEPEPEPDDKALLPGEWTNEWEDEGDEIRSEEDELEKGNVEEKTDEEEDAGQTNGLASVAASPAPLEKMTESISDTEDSRSYTPCLDERRELEAGAGAGDAALGTELISEDEARGVFSDDAEPRRKKPTKKDAKKTKSKDVAFRKLSKQGRERAYRDKARRRSASASPRRRDKRKDLERYDVRSVVTEKRKKLKDPFGRDVSPAAPSRSPSRSPRRPPPPERSMSRERKSPSRPRRSVSRPRRSVSRPRRSVSRLRKSPSRPRRSLSRVRRSPSRPRRSPSVRRTPSLGRLRRSPRSLTPLSPPRRSRSPRRAPRKRRKSGSPRRRASPRRRSPSPARRKRRRSGSAKPKATKKKKRARSAGAAAAPAERRRREERRKSPKRKKAKRRSPTRSPPPPPAAAAGWSPLSMDSRLLSPRTPPPGEPGSPRRARTKRKRRSPRHAPAHKRKDAAAPSKEVFTSGDNILVSVSFADQPATPAERRKHRAARRPRRRRASAAAAAADAAKPVAIIDLERSPFRELTPSPKNVIVLSDSDHGERAPPAAPAAPPPAEPAVGPKTPPEPAEPPAPAPVKFSLPAKPTAAPRAPNPLREEEADAAPDAAEAEARAPSPAEPPDSPDAYDPFEPTRSASGSPAAAPEPERPSMTLEAAQRTNLSADEVLARRPLSPMEKVMALLQSTRDEAPEPPPGPAHAALPAPPGPAGPAPPPPRVLLPEPRPQPKLFVAKPSPIKSNPVKPMQAAPRPAHGDSPYSPGSSDFGDLFSPPRRDPFDAMCTARPSKRKDKSLAKVPVKFNRKKGKAQVGVRLDDDSLKVLDELPSSAVEMQVKSKFLKKLNRQERVVEEVKLVLKPHYTRKRLSKDEYKDILRRAVPKICHNKTGEINPTKIQALVEAYVKKARKKHKLGLA